MAAPRGRGRPTKLTPELQAQIVARIQFFHAPPEAAAASLGIHRSTFYEWVARGLGRDPERPAVSPYIEFADAIVKATGDDELWHWGKLNEFISKRPLFAEGKEPANWGAPVTVQRHRALLWSLEHRFMRPPPPYDAPLEDEGVAKQPISVEIVYAAPVAKPPEPTE